MVLGESKVKFCPRMRTFQDLGRERVVVVDLLAMLIHFLRNSVYFTSHECNLLFYLSNINALRSAFPSMKKNSIVVLRYLDLSIALLLTMFVFILNTRIIAKHQY